MVRSAVSGLSWYDRYSAIVSGIIGDTHRAQPLHVPYGHQRSSASISGPVLVFISEYLRPSAVEKTALRAVGPLYPPALSPPAKAPVAKGGQAGGKGFRGTADEPHTLDGTFRGWWIILVRSIKRNCFRNQ